MHPMELYHHKLVHSHFSGDCTACPHTHPELQHQIMVLTGVMIAAIMWLKRVA